MEKKSSGRETGKCAYCGKEFSRNVAQRVYCSKRCSADMYNAKRRAVRRGIDVKSDTAAMINIKAARSVCHTCEHLTWCQEHLWDMYAKFPCQVEL